MPRRDVHELRDATRRFSRVAMACVVTLIGTGGFQVWRIVGGLDALRDEEYGRILVVKLVVFAVMLVVASFSREIVARVFARGSAVDGGAVELPVVRGGAVDVGDRPAADPGPTGGLTDAERASELRRLRGSVWAEVALGALVLVVTALLVNAVPPAGGAAAREGATGVTVEDPRVTLDITVAPGLAGPNDVPVNTYSPQGTPLAVDAVEMRLALPDRNIAPLVVPLRQLGPGHYLSPGLDIPLAGTWELDATIRLGPVDRVDLTGELEIR
jgi:copper transport protein